MSSGSAGPIASAGAPVVSRPPAPTPMHAPLDPIAVAHADDEVLREVLGITHFFAWELRAL